MKEQVMDNLDAPTKFWLDQGGQQQDAEVRGWQDSWRAAQEPTPESWQGQLNNEIEDAVSSAVFEVSGRDKDAEDWKNSRADRDAIAESYPDSPGLANYVQNKLN